jgi:hypothetical protein
MAFAHPPRPRHRPLRRSIALLAAVGLASLVAGCGAAARRSGSAAAGGHGRAQLADEADLICTTATVQRRAIHLPANLRTKPVAGAAYIVDASAAIIHDETRHLQRLTATPDAAAAWSAFITAQVAGDRVAQALKQRIDAGDPDRAAVLPQAAAAAVAITKAANRLGATACAPSNEPLATN